ncbi:hypothetical protein PXD56_06395 [Maribacter sp. SA7]|uniref:DUF6620 family protein n=1 Tax=Maribacter zhoushanensis TaxID=3030012 RepID=UPI0023ED7962|nr:DUF6620 family protein [Maribacter zhoushanensis]MDF4202573.1 hypothetical protein [Maribacter zhoushanensis]
MEINGVTFRDFACASANMAAGMPIEKICEVLGLELPVWEDTKNQWNGKMAELSHDDMKFYGEVFMNPKQGKFANAAGGAEGPEVALAKHPNWSDYIKMERHYAIAQDVGVEIDLQKEYDVSMTEFSQLAMHWGGQIQSAMQENPDSDKMRELLVEQGELTEKWEAHFNEMYQGQSANLSDDIDF